MEIPPSRIPNFETDSPRYNLEAANPKNQSSTSDALDQKIAQHAVYLHVQQIGDAQREEAIAKSNVSVIQKVRTKISELYIKQQAWDNLKYQFSQAAIDDFKELQELQFKEEFKCSPKEISGFFITLCPAHDFPDSLFMLQKCANKLVRKTGVTSFIYCFEQTGDINNLGSHPHLHMFVQRNKGVPSGEPGKLKSGIQNTIKSFFKDKHNTQIKTVQNGKEQPRIKYIMGHKSSGKPEENELNQRWRNENGLENYYTNENGIC